MPSMLVATSPGVLALQGDFEPHLAQLAALGLQARAVRRPKDLDGLTHLILPGGESTTIVHLLHLFGLWQPIQVLNQRGQLNLFGTCAGAIILAQAQEGRPEGMALLDASVQRNAYGRQLASFSANVPIPALNPPDYPCVFIRAPRIRSVGRGVQVLAEHNGDPVLICARGLLAATFHPELTADSRVHARFLESAPGTIPFATVGPGSSSAEVLERSS